METLSLKLDKSLAKQLEKDVKEFKYSTKTELVREALREKMSVLDKERRKEKAWQALFAARGSLKGKGKTKTDEEFYRWRRENGKELMKEYAREFGIKLPPQALETPQD